MKGLVFDIRSFSVHDGPGIRTTVFMKGCPLRCSWCHNPESQQSFPEMAKTYKRIGDMTIECTQTIGYTIDSSEILRRSKDDMPFFEESGGGITLSGGEPLMQPAFTLFLLKAAKKMGIHSALDTSGFANPEIFKSVSREADLVLFDLKLADDFNHQHHVGQSNSLILNNLRGLDKSKQRYFIRIPLIPETTDTTQNLEGLYAILRNLRSVERIDLLPFHHIGKSKYERLGKEYEFQNIGNYDRLKSERIKNFFSGLAAKVTIGG